MATFYVTFGQKHGEREIHPRFLPAHHDGYLRIDADDIDHAKVIAQSVVGLEYSMLYTAESFPFGLFPRGELASFSDVLHAPVEWERDGKRTIVCSCRSTEDQPFYWGEKGHGD